MVLHANEEIIGEIKWYVREKKSSKECNMYVKLQMTFNKINLKEGNKMRIIVEQNLKNCMDLLSKSSNTQIILAKEEIETLFKPQQLIA